ncbi:MAG: OmpA family protein [Hyphomicrobiales bacterium]|nr:MAG: OmpA family protein [Hyphomicrobiales bacterium]
MSVVSRNPKSMLMLAAFAVSASSSSIAQAQESYEGQGADGQASTTVYGSPPADLTGLPAGPKVEGLISARAPERMQVTGDAGANTIVAISQATEIRSAGGFLGLSRDKLAADQLLNGLPVTVETVEWNGGLVASRIALKSKDLKTASMIRSGTAQGFAEQTAATEALKGRMGDIDKYNIKATTNVNFDFGKAALSSQAKADLCAAAQQAEATDNALLLVVGYTDSIGSQEVNQVLSERRASAVVNYLQQACGWKPYRMLTPTGMAEADPLADNETAQGKAQNRRVAVNVLVSKSVDGL